MADEVSLKEYFEALIGGLRDNVTTAMAAADKAVNKAEQASERRFEGVNEFRQTLSDQAATFVTRNEHASDAKVMQQKYEALSTQFSDLRSELQGRNKGVGMSAQVVLAGVTILIAIAAVVVSLLHK